MVGPISVSLVERWCDWEQGLFYALMVGIMTGRKAVAFGQFVPLRPEVLDKQQFTEENTGQIFGRLAWVVRKIRSESFERLTDKKRCDQCEVREVCTA